QATDRCELVAVFGRRADRLQLQAQSRLAALAAARLAIPTDTRLPTFELAGRRKRRVASTPGRSPAAHPARKAGRGIPTHTFQSHDPLSFRPIPGLAGTIAGHEASTCARV